MERKVFNEIVEEQFDYCIDLLCKKEKEYIHDKEIDRLEAFKLKWLNSDKINSKEVLWGALVKHLNSLYNMCKEDKEYDKLNLNLWKERITDIINYMVLLIAIVYENQE